MRAFNFDLSIVKKILWGKLAGAVYVQSHSCVQRWNVIFFANLAKRFKNWSRLELVRGCTYNTCLHEQHQKSLSEELSKWVEAINVQSAAKSAEVLLAKLARIPSNWARREGPKRLPPKRMHKAQQTVKTIFALPAIFVGERKLILGIKNPAADCQQRDSW